MTKRGTVSTNNIILTFDSTDLPSEIRVGYVKVRVRPFVPAPMRCFRCQRFGHTKDNCRGRPTCSKCASQDHTDETCDSETPRCVNCGEGQTPHSAYDRSCPAYVKEKEIMTIKATRNLSFKEAREVYNQSHPKTSYAQKVRVTNSTDASQMSVAQLVQLLKRFGLTVVATAAATTAAARDACVEDTGRRLDIPVGAATDLRGSRAPRQAADAPELVTLGG
ncbi:Nucleic-acid-binding protein from mobile element jockey [Amphibalanus amphitrite]|uniref:Nucleic-acid-binding protein from mobile element jockey n=1 Tax=Amphibalanus amphitrite TaxID=1232801 RepID=A0A6A4WSI3_AMPAM|nr:Nucleic-acid-binding protein from mobile element jockey [Amphibalanus amphitrite]